ncbi:MAG: F0F1 ATP synthase subunit B [Candidatus Korobacteraceae bacterium]
MNIAAALMNMQGGQVETIARTFGVDWPHLATQIASFAIVCFLLQRWAYRPVIRMLDERRATIAQGLANSERIRTELQNIEAQRLEVIDHARLEAAKIIEKANATAARIRAREKERSIAEAELIVRKSHEMAEQEQRRMRAELKHELGHLIVQAAATLSGKALTEEDQLRLAQQTVDRLAA